MKKVYKKLTQDQIKRGVIFSSTLSKYKTEQTADTMHEVLNSDVDKSEVIARLKNDKFFNGSSWIYNIIRC